MTKKWNAEIMFPRDNDYQNRIVGGKFAPSNDGDPMITLETEVVAPTTKQVGEDIVDITGVKAKYYIMVKALNSDGSVDEAKTKQRQDAVKDFWKAMKLDPATINWDNIDLKPLLKKVILTLMESRVDEQRKEPTKEQLAEAAKKGIHPKQAGTIMKDPITGKNEIKYWPQIVKVYGLAQNQGGGY